MSHKGIPDGSRAARLVLKDYVNGKLLYCYPPPGYDANEFQQYDIDFDSSNQDYQSENADEPIASNQTTSKVIISNHFIYKKKTIFFLCFCSASTFSTIGCRSTVFSTSTKTIFFYLVKI